MTLPVLTAISDPSVEAALVAAFGSESLGVVVTGRCVDLADLLATAAAGTGQAVLVSADLRGLDQGAVGGLQRAGLAVVGLAPARDESAQRRLLQIGVDEVLPADASASRLATSLLALAARPSADAPRQAAAMPGAAPLGEGGGWDPGWDGDASDVEPMTAPGQLIAVWGPAGAPGRTTVAAGLAAELAAGGLPVLLIDADPYGGCIAQLLGMLEEAPGVAAATRAANSGTLDVPQLASLARSVSLPGGSRLRVLTGISRAARWTELRPDAVSTVLDLARRLAAVTVIDCGFSLEQDEELTYDTAAPQRNGATLAAIEAAHLILAVGSADPVGLTRLVRGLTELRALSPPGRIQLVANRIRSAAVPGAGRPEAARREVEQVLLRHAGVRPLALIPLDQAAADRAVAHGRLLCDVAADSPARLALAELAAAVVGSSWRRRPRRRSPRAALARHPEAVAR
ncbi:MAG: AAA family ATPase [Frankiaceae bacterium]